MAKYATRRSYKNRASKKRRTIRKLKRTLRRKIQRGGLGEDVIIKLMLQLAPQVIPVILSLINLGNVELIISIVNLLSGNQPSIGPGGMVRSGWSGWSGGSKSNNRQLQRGGGGLKEHVLGKLNELAIKFESRPDVVACINIIKTRIEKVPEPVAPATATAQAVDSSAELASLTTELTTNTNITPADKEAVDMKTQDTALKALVEKDHSITSDTPVDAHLPQAVEEAAKTSIINKMITFFNERIKSKITAKLDGMISNFRGKIGEDVIPCIQTLKTAIVEDIVTQIKSNVSEISSRILSGIGGVAGGVFQFLVWSAVQMALGNYKAILFEGGNQITQLGNKVIGAMAEKEAEVRKMASNRFNNAKERFNNMFSGNNPVAPIDTPPLSQPSQSAPSSGLFGKLNPTSWSR